MNRTDLMRVALLSVPVENVEEAKIWIEEQGGTNEDQNYLLISLIQGLASSDHETALDKAKEWFDSQHTDEATAVIIKEWTKSDPTGVFDWISQQELSPVIVQSYRQAMREVISQNPQSYSHIVAELSSGEMKNELSKLTTEFLVKESPQAAINWMNTLIGEEKNSALFGLVQGWSDNDDKGAVLDFLKDYRDTNSYEDAFRIAAVNLSYSNPELVQSRYDTMTKEEQVVAADYLSLSLATNNIEQAQLWTKKLDNGISKDIALSRVAGQLQRAEPSSAFKLALEIQNGGRKLKTLKKTIQNLGRIDPVAAQKLIADTNTLEPFEKEELKTTLEKTQALSDIVLPD